MSIHRKILLGVAVLAMPLSTIGVVAATGGTAFAKTGSPGPNISCTGVSETITFAAPGLSQNGAENMSKTDTTTTSTGSGSCGSAGSLSLPALNIVSKATKCKGMGNPDSVCTAKGYYAYDSTSAFASEGESSLLKAIKKLTVTVGGTTISIKNSSASEIVEASPCASNEVGFEIGGTVKSPKSPVDYKGYTSTFVACLLGDTGPNTTGVFATDLGSSTAVIQTASLDTSDSTLTIAS